MLLHALERTHPSSQLEYAVCVRLICIVINQFSSTARQCQRRFSPIITTSISPVSQPEIVTWFYNSKYYGPQFRGSRECGQDNDVSICSICLLYS